jgi:hypothetical protein
MVRVRGGDARCRYRLVTGMHCAPGMHRMCSMRMLPHARHGPRRRDPVQGQREGEQQVERESDHAAHRLRREGRSFNPAEAVVVAPSTGRGAGSPPNTPAPMVGLQLCIVAHATSLPPMMRRLRQQDRLLRTLWVALLLFAVVFKPALVLASETHESSHSLQAGHTSSVPHEGHRIPGDEPATPGDADPWHTLMHLGHCCSHPSTAPSCFPALVSAPGSIAPEIPPLLVRESAGVQHPLRPPIGA